MPPLGALPGFLELALDIKGSIYHSKSYRNVVYAIQYRQKSLIGVFFMSAHKNAFRSVIRRKFPSETRIMDAFMSSDELHITECFGELIGKNKQKYQKIADILEGYSVADETIHAKWQGVQDHLNEAYFGYVNWDTILQELDGERAKQDAVIRATAEQREALRTRIPTTLIVHEQGQKKSKESALTGEPPLGPRPSTRPSQPATVEKSPNAEALRTTDPPVKIVNPVIVSPPANETTRVPLDDVNTDVAESLGVAETAKTEPQVSAKPEPGREEASSDQSYISFMPSAEGTEDHSVFPAKIDVDVAQYAAEPEATASFKAPAHHDVPVHLAPEREQTSFEEEPTGGQSLKTQPSTKEELLRHVEKLYQQKKQELAAIHKKKIDLINTHGEKLLHEAVDDFLLRIRKLETVAVKIGEIFNDETPDPFLTSLYQHNGEQLQNKIADLQKSQTKRQNAINKSWQMAIKNEELRNLEMLDKLRKQIAIARETYNCIEDSGVLNLEKVMQSADSTPWNDMTTNAYVQECKTRLLSDYLDEAALKNMRDTLIYLWKETSEPEILVDMINIFGSLLFSHLPPQSKGKIISILIESMHNRSLVEAARILHHLANSEELNYRLSERDLKRVLSLVESQNEEIRAATKALIEKQLRLEQEGIVPVWSSDLSHQLEVAIGHLSRRESPAKSWPEETLRQSDS